MRKKIIRLEDESGNTFFSLSRSFKQVYLKDGNIAFKDNKGNRIIPTEEELELFNES